MSFDAIRRKIETYFIAGWGDVVPLALDNVDFTPPDGADWVRLRIFLSDTTQASMGSVRTWRTTGSVLVQCFTPLAIGSAQAQRLADDVAVLLQGTVVNGITFRGTSVLATRQSDNWWLVSTSTPFFTDVQS